MMYISYLNNIVIILKRQIIIMNITMSLRVKPRLQRQKDLLQKQRIHPSPIIPQKEVSNDSSHNKENITITIQEKTISN